MPSVMALCSQLAALGAKAQEVCPAAEYEQAEALEVMQRIQATFGDQEAGQAAVRALYQAINHLAYARGCLSQAMSQMNDYNARVRQ